MTVDRFRKLTSFSAVVVIAVAFAFPLGAREASFLPDDSPFVGYEMKIPMRDGTHLVGDVYIPKGGGGPFPVILIQTPYNKANQRIWFAADVSTRWGPLFGNTNYAFVVVDWRGRFASAAAAKQRVPGGNGQDGFDTVAWIAARDFSNGRIGGWGSSALGGAQLKTAAEHPPNLTCIAPAVMPLNLGYDTFFPGGVLWAEFVKMLGRLGFGDLYSALVQQPVKNETWKMIEATTFIKPEDIQVPVLMVGGWYDLYTDGMVDAFNRLRAHGGDATRAHTTLIMGPWLHSGLDQERQGDLEYPGAVGYSATTTAEYFDHFLRGVDNSFDEQPAFHYYQMGAEEWRTTDTWPPEKTTATPFYLQPGGGLARELPADDVPPSSYRFDPSNPAPTVGSANLDPSLKQGPYNQSFANAFRQDTLIFHSPVLEENLAIAGKVTAELFVSSDRPDTDFTAILVDVYPDRRQMLVQEGILRMRFREGTDKEVLMESGTVYQATIEIGNTAITFPKGHRVGVIVSSSSSPKYDVNLNDGGPMYTGGKGLIATNTVHHDEEHPSALILPVVAE
jgi:predicted acyl esterase